MPAEPMAFPAGLLIERDLMDRHPERAEEIIDHAISSRERHLLVFREARKLISWHPIHMVKILFVSGFMVFILAWLVSHVVALNQIYTEARNLITSIPIPFFDPHPSAAPATSRLLNRIPQYGVRESIMSAVLVMGLIALERTMATIINWKKIKSLRRSEDELLEEIRVLETWRVAR
jgi:hypothetical protein